MNPANNDAMSERQSYPLRMPEELREYIENKAKENGRSLQKELVTRLEALKAVEKIATTDKARVDIYSYVIDLMDSQRKTSRLETQIQELKQEVAHLQQTNASLAKQIGQGDTNRQLKIDKIRGQIGALKQEYDELFPEQAKLVPSKKS